MMNILLKNTLVFAYGMLALGAGIYGERHQGQAVRERAAAIDACAREANVYPDSCQMKAVVVSPTEPRTVRVMPDLLPPPVEG
jgi:hypothetical protein